MSATCKIEYRLVQKESAPVAVLRCAVALGRTGPAYSKSSTTSSGGQKEQGPDNYLG